MTPPIAPAPRTIPRVAGGMPSERVAYRTSSAAVASVNTLSVAVAARIGRTIGELVMKRTPCHRPPVAGSALRGGTSTPRRKSAEATNDAASARTATGAVNAATSRPPALGPATPATRLPLTSARPNALCSEGVSGRRTEGG